MTDGIDPGGSMEPSDEAAQALDFALGALDREARQAAQLRLSRDPAFRTEVESWQGALAPFDAETLAVPPPAGLWDRIAAEIMPAPRRAAVEPARTSLWSSLGLWRGLAAAGVAAAIVLFAVRPGTTERPQLLVATLASDKGRALLTATYDASRGAVILTPADKGPADGRTPELWVIEGSNPPRSLGVIDIDTPGSHVIPAERLRGLKPGSTLAISLEPAGGSKTGAPTGPVVATGKLTGI